MRGNYGRNFYSCIFEWRRVKTSCGSIGAASLTAAKLREVNGLIDQYNREVEGFRAVMDKDGDFRFNPLARVDLKDVKNVPDLAGTSWVGESDGWVYTFMADGSYSITSPDGSHTDNSKDFKGGTWRRVEGKLLFKDSADREFEMTIKGDRLYGARFGGSYLTRKNNRRKARGIGAFKGSGPNPYMALGVKRI